MSGMLPMAMFGLEVPAGDVAIPAKSDVPAAFRITMAAIDPSAEPEGDEGAIPRATLKVIRQPLDLEEDTDDEDSEEFDADEMERMLAGSDESDEDSEDDEEANGGPSDPAKSKKARRENAEKQIKALIKAEGMDIDGEEKTNGVNGVSKSAKALGKMPASDDDDEDEDEDDSDMDDSEGEIEEFVICTLDPSKNYQQPLDITIGDDEHVWFKVSGTHSIFLTGNYVDMPGQQPGDMFDPDSDDDGDYDLEPDDDELGDSEDESMDELDDIDDPRIVEVDDDEEVEAPALIKAGAKKIKQEPAQNKNKRAAPEDDSEMDASTLDDMIAKEKKTAEATTNGEVKLSKKQLKKLKKNDGQAGAAPVVEKVKEVEGPASNKSDKKVSFAKELEQGPTPTKATDKPAEKDKSKASLGVKVVQGVTIDDKKLGSGQAAKNGDRVGMRYIGKLKDNNKVFDSNKKGKPFTFKLGAGEVIKGWEIGLQGIQVGGERRITIPAHLAYGSKRNGDIPPNSALVFDVKAMEIGKGGK